MKKLSASSITTKRVAAKASKPATASKKRAPVKKSSKGTAYVAKLLDQSGSMNSINAAAIKMANEDNASTVQNAATYDEPTSLSMYVFDSVTDIVFENRSTGDEIPEYKVGRGLGGRTALFDAVLVAIDRLKAFGALKPHPKDSFLVNVVTDGEDNYSRGIQNVVKLMNDLTALGNWTFTFQVPKGYKDKFVRESGVPSGNVSEWEQSVEGTRTVAATTNAGTAAYFAGKSQGQLQTKGFFETNLSKVSAKKVTKNLDDLTKQFRVIAVPKEAVIKDFIEEKTKKVYVTGSTYYQLTKEEKAVQPYKQLLVMKKGEKKVYGGDAARELIGLPPGVTVKVVPGNHADFDIFIESRSYNRKLVRGTKVLLDKTKVTNSTPTWQPTSV
jgi:hypothetical protein